jgi:ribosomal-protein-alanine N-acetyltransferase
MPAEPELHPATLADLPVMQNLGRFYVYDIARYCGHLPGWECPEDGLWECIDFAPYFAADGTHPFILRAGGVPAGFVVVKRLADAGCWNMEQFYVTAPYQRRGNGARLLRQVLARFPGAWRIEIIPENARALAFWRQVTAAAAPAVEEATETVPPGAARIVLRFAV